MIALLMLSCATEAPIEAVPVVNELPVTKLARRISLDVRGIAPTIEDYRTLLADDSELERLVGEWLGDDRFGDRVVELYSEIYLTRSAPLPFSADVLGLSDRAGFERSIGEEPLRILAQVAENDRPWTEIVTADYTMATPSLAEAFSIDRPAGEGWQVSQYTDGRPSAGILSTTGMWWRYTSTPSNANRKRANQVSRILLCNDYLTRPVDFDRNVNLLDEGAVLDALQTDPACVSCHVSLDPLAGYFYGFWILNEASAIDASRYHPERERLWEPITGVAPGYYGQPGFDLQDLGVQVASDPRFVECAVDQAYELLLRRDPAFADEAALTEHRQAFIQGGLTLRSLFASILADPLYRATHDDDEGAASLRYVTPDLLASQVEGLTGFRWTFTGDDMLSTDRVGLRTLAGGADGYAVTEVSRTPNATSVLVQQRLAELAVAQLQAEGASPWFGVVEPNADPEPQRIADLVLAVLGDPVATDSEPVTALAALFGEIEKAEGRPSAWAGLVYALFRDPDFVTY
ncbi:MAG: hypothetical protein AAGA48_10285 [Myxococcota bacterium]